MSKRIHVTVAIEIEDDDYEGELKQAVENKDYDYFTDLLVDLYNETVEDALPVVGIETYDV